MKRFIRVVLLLIIISIGLAAIGLSRYLNPPTLVGTAPFAILLTAEDETAAGHGAGHGDARALVVNQRSAMGDRWIVYRIPRDLLATTVFPDGRKRVQRINALPDPLVRAWIAKHLGFSVSRSVRLRFTDYVQFVNAIDGIEVDLGHTRLPAYTDHAAGEWGHFPAVGPGVVTADGRIALAIARNRRDEHGKVSDTTRITRQATVEAAIVTKLASVPGNPASLLRLRHLITHLRQSGRCDLTEQEIVSLAWRLRGARRDGRLRRVVLPTRLHGPALDLAVRDSDYLRDASRLWLSGAVSRSSDVLVITCAAGTADSRVQQIRAAAERAGFHTLVYTDAPTGITGMNLTAPIGVGRDLSRRLREQGIVVPVRENWRARVPVLHIAG